MPLSRFNAEVLMNEDEDEEQGQLGDGNDEQLDWSAEDIAYYLETGFTPDFDSAGGEMADVVANMAHLTPEDRTAIAAYVKAVPAAE